ncbi:hypothetical protein [Spirosoma aerophilum]
MKRIELIGIAFTLLVGIASLCAIVYYKPDLLITSLWGYGGVSCIYYGVKNIVAFQQKRETE